MEISTCGACMVRAGMPQAVLWGSKCWIMSMEPLMMIFFYVKTKNFDKKNFPIPPPCQAVHWAGEYRLKQPIS